MVIFLTLKAVSQNLCETEQHSSRADGVPWPSLGVGGSSGGRSQVGGSCSRAVPACQLSVRRNWLHDWVWGCLMLVYQQHLLIFFLPWWQLRLFGSPHSRSASLTVSSCPPWHENYVWIIQKRYAAKTAQSCYNCLRRLYGVEFSVTVLYCIHPAIFFFFCIAFYRIFTGENGGSRGSNKQRLRIRVSVCASPLFHLVSVIY